MARTADQIQKLIGYGANVMLDATSYSIQELRDFAAYAKNKNVKLHITNTASLSTEDLQGIAAVGSDKSFHAVTFDLT